LVMLEFFNYSQSGEFTPDDVEVVRNDLIVFLKEAAVRTERTIRLVNEYSYAFKVSLEEKINLHGLELGASIVVILETSYGKRNHRAIYTNYHDPECGRTERILIISPPELTRVRYSPFNRFVAPIETMAKLLGVKRAFLFTADTGKATCDWQERDYILYGENQVLVKNL
jgi:hypothetical protein